MSRYLLLLGVVLLVSLVLAINSCAKRGVEVRRLESNQRTLLDKALYYKTKDSLSVASVEQLSLTRDELQENCQQLVQKCKTLEIKIKRLLSASTAATETRYLIKTNLRDSLRVRDSLVVDTLKCFSYNSKWLSFAGCTADGVNYDVNIESRDTLTTIVHRVPRRFLFFKYGTKAIRQEVISSNPHTNIVYTEYIKIIR